MDRILVDETPSNSLTIPAILPYGRTWGAWTIAFCREKLRVKYESTHESLEYDSYIATRDGADPSWRHRIEREDVEKTRLINSKYTDREIDDLMWRIEAIGQALRHVPDELALEDPVPDEVYDNIARVFHRFIRPGVRLPKAAKVFFMKRPRLIPMLDSYVLGFLFQEEVGRDAATGIRGMRQFRELMRYGNTLNTLRAVAADTNAWLHGLVAKQSAPDLTTVRVLDHLLWFDWNGYAAFGWVCDGSVVRPR